MSKRLVLTAVAATLSGFLLGQYREGAAPWDRAVEVQSSAVAQGELLFAVSSSELLALEMGFQQAVLAGERASAMAMIPRLTEMA
jgi:hypothetical protein